MSILREGYKDTEIGVIPVDWEVVKLQDISKITMGQSPKSNTYNTDNIGIPLIQGNADCKNRKTIPRTYTTELTKECFVGDSIMTVRAPVGAISKSLHNACIGRGVCAIQSKEDNEYIYHSLIDYEDKWTKLSQGSTFTAVSGNDVKSIKIPLPPLKEQEKIASILSTADEKIEAIAEQIQKHETLKKGLLQKLLSEGIGHTEFKESELGSLPVRWEVVKLGNIGNLEGGFAFKSKEYTDNKLDYQVIRMSNINSKGLNLSKDPKYIHSIEKRTEKYILNVNDLLITLTGTIGKTDYGNIALISEDRKMVLNQRVGRFVINSSNNTTQFLYYVFNHQLFRSKFFEFGKGGTGNQANVGRRDFETIKIILPPLQEQKQIADILSTADEKLEVLRAKKEKFETLKKGLLQKLLSGEVRV